jgi:hypothetical protein
MAAAERDKPRTGRPTRTQGRRTIPPDSGGAQYTDELDLYLNQLLDEALDETLPGRDALSRQDVDKK